MMRGIDFASLLISIPPLLLAVTIHEVAHGYVAYRMGDHTARMLGRLTLNPVKHIDPVGTVLFPLMLAFSGSPVLFGWAKPVPINPSNFKNRRKDMVRVSFAGPASNLLLAVAFAAAFKVMLILSGHQVLSSSPVLAPLASMLLFGIQISIYLALFNLLPIHPLDGSHVLEGFLPREAAIAYSKMAPYGWIILLALLFTGILGIVIRPFFLIIYGGLLTIFGF